MKPRITFITLGVDDLQRAVAFYRDGLGLSTQGIVGGGHEHAAVAFFDMQPGLKLALWPRKSLAAEAGVTLAEDAAQTQAPVAAARDPAGFALAHNVATVEAVSELLDRARAAGAVITKPATPTFYGGHAGYFKDLDGHLWEVAYNPRYEIP